MTLRKLHVSRSAAVLTQTKEAPSGTSDVTAFIQLIERVARDPSIDIDKLDRLLLMRERENARIAETAFSAALAAAQTEMQPVVADSPNSQTRSRYASYAALDRAVRSIYTRHGFGLTFNTEDSLGPEQARVTCDVCHSGGHTRQYRIDMPVDGKGARGGDVMSKTHAMGSGVSYGMRYLLRMIFNLAVDHDDDGNAASGYRTRGCVSASANGEGAARTTLNNDASAPDNSTAALGTAGDASPSEADRAIEARRAAVQLSRALPQMVVEPPKRRLDRELDRQRHTGANFEARIHAEKHRAARFQQPLPAENPNMGNPQVYNERSPPPSIYDDAGIPPFLDRRRRR